MWWKRNKITKEMIANLRPTSKASLKQMCLYSAKGDIEQAQKLYDYMIKDMEDLPMFDVPQPSTIQQVKQGVSDTLKWVNDNQEQILVWADILQGFLGNKKNRGGGGSSPAAVINPIPSINQ